MPLRKYYARYYQEIAINRAIKAILQGKKRVLLTLATGTGKTYVSYQIIWKLWNTRWNRMGKHRRPKVLYLADRNVIFCVDQEHAEEMRKALNNLNLDLARQYPDYVCRVVSEHGSERIMVNSFLPYWIIQEVQHAYLLIQNLMANLPWKPDGDLRVIRRACRAPK